jgi:hypothetical protein
MKYWPDCRGSLLGCEFMMVAFRSAKAASLEHTFAEQKALSEALDEFRFANRIAVC